MSNILYYAFNKFGQNQSSNVGVRLQCEKNKTKWPPVAHVGSYHKKNQRLHLSNTCSVLVASLNQIKQAMSE